MQIRQLPRSTSLYALLALVALIVLAFARMDRLSDALPTDALGSLASIGAGLMVAALVLWRVSARR